MLCKKPFTEGNLEYGCGQCMPCRANRVRLWTGRMLLEAKEHPSSVFVTLTYKPECLEMGGILVKKHLQDFLKALRHDIYPQRIRYYAVGEYGDKNFRPHYHLLIFGMHLRQHGSITRCWSKGFNKTGTCTAESIGYVAQYVTKKMTNWKDDRLGGRPPEFAVMSLRPGIGYGVVDRYVKAYKSKEGQAAIKRDKWIKETVHTEGKNYPLGRYLKEKIYDKLDIQKDDRDSRRARIDFDRWRARSGRTCGDYYSARRSRVDQANGRFTIRRGKTKSLA